MVKRGETDDQPDPESPEDARAEALAGQLRHAVDEKLRERASAPSEPLGEERRVVTLSEEQLSGMLQRAAKGGLSGALPPSDDISEAELASLPLPPFAGASLKRFRRVPRWPRPGAYTLWVEGPGELETVVAHYLAIVQAEDPAATPEPHGRRVRIKSQAASADVDISVYEDGTLSAQIMYGGW
jgi:hypothetical protein